MTGDQGCTVIKARRIYDLGDPTGRWFRSLAVRNGRVVASSEEPDELDGLASSKDHLCDAGDLSLLSGYFDSHGHFLYAGLDDQQSASIGEPSTIAELVVALAAAARERATGEWIITSRAWNEGSLAERRLPTAEELDGASRDHPICLRRGGSIVVTNTLAMRVAGIAADTPDPGGGRLERDKTGRPNGRFHGPGAIRLIARHFPAPTQGDLVSAIETMALACAERGVTSIRDVGVQRRDMLAFHLAQQTGRLAIRARVLLRLDPRLSLEEHLSELDAWPVSSGFGNDVLRIDAAMLIADGGIEGAATSFGYATDAEFRGRLFTSDAALTEVVDAAVERGWRVACAVVGDRGIDQVLLAYERVAGRRPGLPPGWFCLDHAMLATPSQRARARAAGIAVTMQYGYLYMLAEAMGRCWGSAAVERALPVRDWVREHPLVAAGSGYNTAPANPLLSVWAMTNRATRDGPAVGRGQAVTRRQALELWTVGGRRVFDGIEGPLLAKGRLADLVGYRADPLECPIDELPVLAPSLTLVGGRTVHDRR